MENVLGRYKNLTILVGVLFLQVLGLAVQVKRSKEAADTRLIRIWAVDAITPFERVVVWAENGVGNIWHNYFYLRGVRAENRDLKEQIEQMRLEQVRLTEDATQAHRLQALLSFKEQYISKTVAAQVIGTDGTDSYRVYIDKGSDAGVKTGMAVITATGIVGKVTLVYSAVSEVLLINDQTSGVGAILEKTRLQGVLRGTSNGEVVLEHVMSDEQVPLGETVLTSGGDQIFPKGLPVGTVSKVSPGKDVSLNIKIKPAANLSKLEEVLVVVEKQQRQAPATGSAPVRAADILAERLPSVPEKPAAESGKTGTGAGAAVNGVPAKIQPKPDVKLQTGSVAATSGTTAPQAPGTTGTKPPISTSVNAPKSGNGTAAGGTHSAPVSPPPTGDVLKPVSQTSGPKPTAQNNPQKNASGNSGSVNGTSNGTLNGTSATKPANPASQSTAAQVKPIATPPVASPSPSSAEPPAADDGQH